MEFSIIVPYYNTAVQLERLIRSICNSELFKNGEIEVFIVNDRSTENIEAYENLKLKYTNVIFLENDLISKGAGTARNIGLKSACGKWVLFADADDYFVEGWDKVLKKYSDCGADMVYFTPDSFNELTLAKGHRHEGWCKFIEDYIKNPSRENELRLRYLSISPCSKMILRDLLNKNNIMFEEIMVGNDIMFCRQAAYYSDSIEAVDEVIYNISENTTSLTTKKTKDYYYIRINAFIRSYRFLKHRLSYKDLKMSGLNGFENYILSNEFDISKIERIGILLKMILCGVRFVYWDDIHFKSVFRTIFHYLFADRL